MYVFHFKFPSGKVSFGRQLKLHYRPYRYCHKNKIRCALFWETKQNQYFFFPPSLLFSLLQFLISDRDRDPQCNLHCSRSQSKPLCASDGRTYESMCDYQRAKCRESSLSVTHRGRCKGRWISNAFEGRNGSPTLQETGFLDP